MLRPDPEGVRQVLLELPPLRFDDAALSALSAPFTEFTAVAVPNPYPVLEGNATVVYRAEAALDGSQASPVERAADENTAYLTLDQRNTAYLKSHGVETAHP